MRSFILYIPTLPPYRLAMSAAAKLTKKQKKALAFRERKSKGKAKATDEDLDNDVPIMEDQDIADAEVEDTGMEGQKAGQSKDHSRPQVVEGKKRKRDTSESGEQDGEKTKPKKRKKDPEQAESTMAEEETGEAVEEKNAEGKKKKDKQQRLILFVGALRRSHYRKACQCVTILQGI